MHPASLPMGEHAVPQGTLSELNLQAKAVLPDALYMRVMARGLVDPAVPSIVL